MNIIDRSKIKVQEKSFSIDEKDIWLNFINGDRKSFADLYDAHIVHLYNYGMKIEPNSEFIEDCIQELFVELWEQRKNLSFTDNVKYYLLKALRFKIYRQLNSAIKRKRNFSKNYKPFHIDIDLPYEDLLINEQINAEKKIKLHKALKKLSARQREVLNLIFFEKYTYENISVLMSMSIRSVYTLAWKALSSLKKSDFL
ncbi:sigma-70 family RNA polymerase sigma factor [soil metagenome]